MTITARLLCLLVALLCFAVAAFGIGTGRINLIGAGGAFLTAAFIVG